MCRNLDQRPRGYYFVYFQKSHFDFFNKFSLFVAQSPAKRRRRVSPLCSDRIPRHPDIEILRKFIVFPIVGECKAQNIFHFHGCSLPFDFSSFGRMSPRRVIFCYKFPDRSDLNRHDFVISVGTGYELRRNKFL